METEKIDSGVAFVFEGETEQIFYESLLVFLNGKHQSYILSEELDEKVNEHLYYSKSEGHNVLIRMKTVSAITQIHNVSQWFKSSCQKQNNMNLKWTIFLCYDTDSYKEDVSKFYKGDWKRLRKKLQGKNIEIIDFAASSMIEDLFLLDPNGICNYLAIENQKIPKIGNGKTTLKNFFRQANKIYHEGEKSSDFIYSLDKEKIIANTSLSLATIEQNRAKVFSPIILLHFL